MFWGEERILSASVFVFSREYSSSNQQLFCEKFLLKRVKISSFIFIENIHSTLRNSFLFKECLFYFSM